MATRTSVANGAWDSITTWDTGIPVDGDTAIINHNVYIDSNVTVGTGASSSYAITINNGGILRWANPPTGNWTLTLKGGVYISSGGKFRIGTSSAPIPSTAVADVYFAAPSDNLWWQIYIAEGGEFDAWGSRYHMDDDEMQRAKLVGNIVAGSVSFEIDRDADWHVGDWIAIGCGADKTYTPNRVQHCTERVQITGKTDARHYTATFSFIHRSGDHIISLERNVVIRGNGQYRGVHINAYAGGTGISNTRCRLSWVAIRFAGQSSTFSYAAIQWESAITNPTAAHPADAFVVKNVVFDRAGEIGTGAPPHDRPYSYGIAIQTNVPFADTWCISDISAYAMGVVVYIFAAYNLDIVNVVGIDTGSNAVAATGSYVRNVHLDGVWACARDWQNSSAIMLYGDFAWVDNVECFNVYTALYWQPVFSNTSRMNSLSFYNWKIYSTYSYPVYYSSGVSGRPVVFDTVEVYNARVPCSFLGGLPKLEFYNCTFDACNLGGYSSDSAVKLMGSARFGDVLFDSCSFGIASRNNYANVTAAMLSGNLNGKRGRIRAVNCTFVEPTNWASVVGTYLYYNKTQLWSIFPYTFANWQDRITFPASSSIEMTNCAVLSAGAVDQWALDYSTARHIAMTVGGGEMTDEPSVVIDGTFCRRLCPLHCVEPMWANAHEPIPIPVAAGQTVTVKLSMRKTNDGQIAVPGIRLEGPGIFDEAYMTRGLINTWEELTVSGTAVCAGTCYLLVSGGTNNASTMSSGSQDPLLGPPPIVTNWRDMFSCTVYADGLKIMVV